MTNVVNWLRASDADCDWRTGWCWRHTTCLPGL